MAGRAGHDTCPQRRSTVQQPHLHRMRTAYAHTLRLVDGAVVCVCDSMLPCVKRPRAPSGRGCGLGLGRLAGEAEAEAWSRSGRAKMASCKQSQRRWGGSGTRKNRDGLHGPLNGCCERVPIGLGRRFSTMATDVSRS
jgi:hypothetical protein